MKCLFCGKELPLLKRFAGAEFCSEEHRQQYRQEYSELALSRLAQQKSAAADSKAALPTKAQPEVEAAKAPLAAPLAPKSTPPSPSMKLTEPRPDPRKAAPRPMAEAKSAEPKIGQPKIVAAPKPTLVTKSRPVLTPTPAISANTTSEPARGEPKKLPITAPPARPVRSLVPLQETRALKVTETKASDAKAQEAKTPEAKTQEAKPAELKTGEPARPSRSSAHTPLRLELPPGAPGQPGPRMAPDRRVIPTPDVHKTIPDAQQVEAPVAGPVEQLRSAEVAPKAPERREAIHNEPMAGESSVSEPVISKLVMGKPAIKDAPDVAAPAPLAGLVRSQPPCADWMTGTRRGQLQLASVLQPQRPPGRVRPGGASLNGASHLSSTEILSPWAPPLRALPARLEIREFARLRPVLEFKPIVEAPRVATADHALGLSFAALALQAEPKLWAEPAREFGIWLDPAPQAEFLESLRAVCDVLKDPAASPQSSPHSTQGSPAQGSSSEDIATAGPRAAVNGKTSFAPDASDSSGEPEPVTLAKTIASEGVPGGKAKPVQMFTSTLQESMQSAIPHYEALPLRATMVVGPSGSSAGGSSNCEISARGTESPTGAAR
jgi:hypothetical protein